MSTTSRTGPWNIACMPPHSFSSSCQDHSGLESHMLGSAESLSAEIPEWPHGAEPLTKLKGSPEKWNKTLTCAASLVWGLFVIAASVTISYTDLPIFVFPVPTTECGCVINWINQVQHLHLWSRAAQTCYQFRKNKIKYILFIIKKKHHKEVKTLKSNQL